MIRSNPGSSGGGWGWGAVKKAIDDIVEVASEVGSAIASSGSMDTFGKIVVGVGVFLAALYASMQGSVLALLAAVLWGFFALFDFFEIVLDWLKEWFSGPLVRQYPSNQPWPPITLQSPFFK